MPTEYSGVSTVDVTGTQGPSGLSQVAATLATNHSGELVVALGWMDTTPYTAVPGFTERPGSDFGEYFEGPSTGTSTTIGSITSTYSWYIIAVAYK